MFGFFLLMFHEKLLSCNTETGPIKGHNSDPGQPGQGGDLREETGFKVDRNLD